MKRRFRLSFVALTVMVALLFTGPQTSACGPFSVEAIFVFTVHPEYPLENFARGNLGVIQPTYARSYLYVAYRHLSGIGFNAKEQLALNELWKERLDPAGGLGEQAWIDEWNTARAKVAGPDNPPKIDVYRQREKPNEYETYLNCQSDAFATAAVTLEARIKKFGADSAVVKEWLKAQDQVFANCAEGQHIPQPATEIDPLGRSDREYQLAAANFYAGNYDLAIQLFETIAIDPDSPWRETAPYLVVRSFVRKASLGAAETKPAALGEAETRLNKILSDQKLASFHPAAQRLLSVVRLRLHPETRLHELGHSLLAKNRDGDLKQDLWDYTLLLDDLVGKDSSDKPGESPKPIDNDDLTDWIRTFESTAEPQALDHSLARWEVTRSTPWLVAVLSKINGKHARAAEVTAVAGKITPDSPAYATAVFNLVRMALQTGNMQEARGRLDDAVQKARASLNNSALNQLLNLRMAVAVNLEDFLKYSQRLPAGLSFNDDGREIPENLNEDSETTSGLRGKQLFDNDAARTINQAMPLAMLKEATESKTLAEHLRRDLTQAAWLRAVLLGDDNTARELVPTLKELVPKISPLLDDFTNASQPNEAKFAALYAWLKFPGLEPVVDAGIIRRTDLGEQDVYRDNWWCGSAFTPGLVTTDEENQKKAGYEFKLDLETLPVFLTKPQRAVAGKEYSMLMALGAAPNYLCRQVVLWGTKNPDDPRVPEALHLAVKATRYGCTNKETGRWSKAAFDLLHKRYPTSAWAKQTPYWFKD